MDGACMYQSKVLLATYFPLKRAFLLEGQDLGVLYISDNITLTLLMNRDVLV